MTIPKRTDATRILGTDIQTTDDCPVDRHQDHRFLAAILAGSGLSGIAVVHVIWASGSTWPATSRDSLADLVVGIRPFPSTPATGGVATLISLGVGLLFRESWKVGSRLTGGSRDIPASPADRTIRFAALCVPAALGLRGVAGLLVSALQLGPAADVYRRWDLRIYSPLSLALAVAAYVAVRRGA